MYLKDKLNLSTERTYTDEGYLVVPSRIGRTGIQEYLACEMGVTDRDPNEIIKVYRPPEEVFRSESLESFANKPITLDHPPELVSAKNFKNYGVGFSGQDVVRDGNFIKAQLRITDDLAIQKIQSGKVELSNGYVADIEWDQGVTPNGEHYDAVQKNICGNHIAIVDRARAGSACKIADQSIKSTVGKTMKVTIDSVDYEVSEPAAQAIAKLQMRLDVRDDDDQIKAKAKDKELEEAKKENDKMRAKLDDALAKVPNAEMLDQMVADRTELIDNVRKVSPQTEWKGKDANTLRREVVAAQCSNVQMDSVSDEYVKARFDMLVESFDSEPQKSLSDAITQQLTKNTDSDDRSLSDIARDKFINDSTNLWKNGGAK